MAITHLTPDKTVNAVPTTSHSDTIDVPAGRIAVGVTALMTDNGDQFTITFDGVPQVLTLKNTSLENIATTRFEDGVVFDVATGGSKTLTIAQTAGAPGIEGVIVRAPDPISGIVQDQGMAHCYPLATLYNGSIYRVHIEMYTGNVHLSIDGVPWGKLFDGIAADRNDNYHFGAAVCSHPGGIVFARVGHNKAQISLRFAPGGDMDQLTAATAIGDAGGELTYCQMDTDAAGNLYIITRGDLTATSEVDLILYTVVNTASTPTITSSIVVIGNTRYQYPRLCKVMTAPNGNELLVIASQERATTTWWGEIAMCVYNITDGTWKGTNPAVSGIGAGTHADPIFSAAQSSLTTGDAHTGAGIVLLRILGSGDTRYVEGMVVDPTAWPTNMLTVMPFFDDPLNSTGLDYGTTDLRWMHHTGLARTVVDAAFDAAMTDPNSFRVLCAMCWKHNDPSTGIAYVILGDRGTRTDTNEWSESVEQYYDWGTGSTLDIFEVSGADTATPVAVLKESVVVQGGYTAWRMTPVRGLANAFVYDRAVNELHQTHRQIESGMIIVDVPPQAAGGSVVKPLRYRFI